MRIQQESADKLRVSVGDVVCEESGRIPNWFSLELIKDEEKSVLFEWPAETERMWEEHLRDRTGLGIGAFFKRYAAMMRRMPIEPAILVVFPDDYRMSGHCAKVRRVWENMPILNYELCRAGLSKSPSSSSPGMGGCFILSKYILRKMAEESPLFQGIWADLKDISPDEHGIYLAPPPDPAWLEAIQHPEDALWTEYHDTKQMDMMGLDLRKPTKWEVTILVDAATRLVQDDYVGAVSLLRGLLFDSGEYWWIWEKLVDCLRFMGDPEQAYEVVREGMRRYPDCYWFDKMGHRCCMDMGNFKNAEWHLRRVQEANPWDPFLMIRYALLMNNLGRHAEAVVMYRDCMEHRDLGVGAQTDLGVSLAKSGRIEEALQVFRQIESQGELRPLMLNNIGMLLAGLGRPQEALTYCRRAIELDGARSGFWDSMGFAYLKLDEYAEAERHFLKAVEIDPLFPDAWRHLLHVYDRTGEQEKLAKTKARVGYYLPKELERFVREQGAEIAD